MASVSPASAPAPVSTLRTHLDTLTGARGIAAMFVYITHSGMEPVFRQHEINQTIVDIFVSAGEASVAFFFMLSGFVLMWATKRNESAWSFWRRRVVKIYPNVAVTWVAALLLMIIAGEFTGIVHLIPGLTLIHVWIPVESVIEGVDGPAWSLSCEVFFYALFPLLMAGVLKLRREQLWRYAVGVLGGLIVITAVIGLVAPTEPKALGQDVPLVQFYLLIFFPPVRLLDFLLGMLVARIVIEGLMPRLRWSWVVTAVAVGWVIGSIVPAPLGWVIPMIPACVLILGRASASDLEGERNVLNSPFVVWLGNVSFAFYLIHWLVLHYGRVFLGGGPWSTPAAIVFLVGALALSLGLGHLLWAWVEVPAMRRWSRPRRKPVDSVITPTGVRATVE